MMKNIKGKAYVLGDDIDTDQIIPANHLVYSLDDPKERKLYGKYALSGVPESSAGLPDGNHPFISEGEETSEYRIIIGGQNFGCGSSREQAVICLKQIGIGAVIAKSFSRIFYRNAINQGLLIVESFEAVDFIQNMDELEINLDDSYIFNKTKNQYFKINPLPAFMQNIINHGGLINTIK